MSSTTPPKVIVPVASASVDAETQMDTASMREGVVEETVENVDGLTSPGGGDQLDLADLLDISVIDAPLVCHVIGFLEGLDHEIGSCVYINGNKASMKRLRKLENIDDIEKLVDHVVRIKQQTGGRQRNRCNFWLDIQWSSDEVISEILERFGKSWLRMHQLSVSDVKEESEPMQRRTALSRERFERFPAYDFVVLEEDMDVLTNETIRSRSPSIQIENPASLSDKHSVASSSALFDAYGGNRVGLMHFLMYDDHIVSIHHEPLPHLMSVLDRLFREFDLVLPSASWAVYAWMSAMLGDLRVTVQNIEEEVETLDGMVHYLSSNEYGDVLQRMSNARRRLYALRHDCTPKQDIIRRLLSGRLATINPYIVQSHSSSKAATPVVHGALSALGHPPAGHSHGLGSPELMPVSPGGNHMGVMDIRGLGDSTDAYLLDLQDHIKSLIEKIEHLRDLLTQAHANYAQKISIEIANVSNHTNDVVSRFTILAAAFVPLTFITGLWGMNVHVPGQDAGGYRWFIGILVMSLVVTMLSMYSLHRWMRRNISKKSR